VIGSPPCTEFSILNQGLNKDKGCPLARKKRMLEATTLLHFALEIYELQVRAGRHFIHEHPQSASSWRDEKMIKMMQHPDVGSVVTHLCQFGMKTKGKNGEWQPAKKATRFASSAIEVLHILDKKCGGKHIHGHLLDGKAKQAAIYPPKLCRAIIKGVENQRLREGAKAPSFAEARVEQGCGLYSLDEDENIVGLSEETRYEELEHEKEAFDDYRKSRWGDAGKPANPGGSVEKSAGPQVKR
jgi:hypothetical protein